MTLPPWVHVQACNSALDNVPLQELRAVSLVGDQLSGFAADMERDSKAQRLELGAAVDAVARRGEHRK